MEPTTAPSEQGVADYDGPQLARETRGIQEQADRLRQLTCRIGEQLDSLAKQLDPVLSPMDVPGMKGEPSDPRPRPLSAVASEVSARADELEIISSRIGNIISQVDV
jgi:hypothetical protein